MFDIIIFVFFKGIIQIDITFHYPCSLLASCFIALKFWFIEKISMLIVQKYPPSVLNYVNEPRLLIRDEFLMRLSFHTFLTSRSVNESWSGRNTKGLLLALATAFNSSLPKRTPPRSEKPNPDIHEWTNHFGMFPVELFPLAFQSSAVMKPQPVQLLNCCDFSIDTRSESTSILPFFLYI